MIQPTPIESCTSVELGEPEEYIFREVIHYLMYRIILWTWWALVSLLARNTL